MKREFVNYIKGATNAYRTKNFIVTQVIGIKFDTVENNVIFSHDTLYRRSPLRDAEYEAVFFRRKHINGKRLHSMMYERTYID